MDYVICYQASIINNQIHYLTVDQQTCVFM